MFPNIEIKHNIGNTITIPTMLDVKTSTYLSDNTAIGVSSISVDNAENFSVGTIILLLSSPGMQNCEIVNSIAHTNQAFTTSATTMPHNRGDIIQQINYDQVVVSKSSTIDGSYVVSAVQTLNVTQQNTVIYDPTGLTTDYYKVQWRNSQSTILSDYSDPQSVDSYPTNSVASIINPVLMAMGVSKNDPKINTEFLISAVNDARKFTDAKLFGIRQDWREEFEYGIKLLAGTNYVDLPDNIDFKYTDRSILGARFLIDNILTPYNLRYIDKRSWNQIAFSVMGSELSTAAGIGATTLVLNNTGDFYATGGVAYVATAGFNETIMQIQYTANDKTTNTLLGVTGVTRAIPAGIQLWTRPTISQPIYYTVFENRLVFDRIIPDSMQGFNVYIDFYKKLDDVETLYQVLPENYREMYKSYLRYAVKYRKDLNTPNDDPDLKKFEDLVQALFNNLYTGQDTAIITS